MGLSVHLIPYLNCFYSILICTFNFNSTITIQSFYLFFFYLLKIVTVMERVNEQHKYLSIYYQNVRGLRTKTHSFLTSLLASDYDVIVITETWLCNGIMDSELFTDSYIIYRRDRPQGMGGGVLIAVNRRVRSNLCPCLTLDPYESLGVNINFEGVSHTVIAVYIPCSSSFQYFDTYLSHLESCYAAIGDKLIFLGDFNLPEITNDRYCLELGSPSARRLASFVNFYELALCNTVLNCNNRILDLVFSSIDINVERCDYFLVPEDAHHPSLVITVQMLSTFPNSRSNCIELYDFRRADYLMLYTQLRDCHWELIYNSSGVDEAVDIFYNFIYECFDNCVPKRRVRPGGTKYPPWFNAEIIGLMKRKDRCAKKKSFSLYHLEQFKSLRTRVKQLIARQYSNYISRVESGIKSDVKSFWGFVNSRRTNGSTHEGMHLGDQVFGLHDLPDGFAQYFSSVFSDDTHLADVDDGNINPGINIPSLSIGSIDLSTILAAMVI
ncbi:uncharacterized protein LOC120353350 [Nilaparvata lugens]|uniref:uncharacterized protein LOC120353350 n=1 Tax=Nilaparvata lugens TaxID=108931 RepID=UPI00193C9297|nr:uncharacterized protein LOC120353350 [Nilaparvata lugens]